MKRRSRASPKVRPWRYEPTDPTMKLIDRILSPDNMRAAWDDISDKGSAAGVDGISVKRWRRNWEERLADLAQAVKGNTYKPLTLRRYSKPKKSGGYRHYAIPTVTERVLQRAALRVIDDRFERLFLDCSYGYRPGRSVADAVRQIVLLRVNDYQWVLDADIDECFDSLDHELIQRFFDQEVKDPIVRRLIRQWLKVGRRDADIPKGIPLGAVVSPLLCNIYLHRIDLRLTELGYYPIRYADDFCVFCATEPEAQQALADTKEIVAELKLQLEPSKTAITTFDEGFDYLGVWFERDEFSYQWKDKRIEVKGDFDWLFYDYVPDGYR